MQLTQKRWEILGEEITGMLQSHPELDPEVMRGLLHKVWDLNQREGRKEHLWGVPIAKPVMPVHLSPEEWEGLSLEEHALILASFRALERSSDEDV